MRKFSPFFPSSFRDSTYGEGGAEDDFNGPELIGEDDELTGELAAATPVGQSSSFFPSGPQTASTSFSANNGRSSAATGSGGHGLQRSQPAMGNRGLESQRQQQLDNHARSK